MQKVHVMIRRFLLSVIVIVLLVYSIYTYVQLTTVQNENKHLKSEVISLKKEIHRLNSSRNSRKNKLYTKETTATVKAPQSPAEWLSFANEHADKAKSAFDKHDYGTAQEEFNKSINALHMASKEPVSSTQNSINDVRKKLTQLETRMSVIFQEVKAKFN